MRAPPTLLPQRRDAAKTIATVIDPMTPWDPSNQSYHHRLEAAIHAGIVLYDVRSGVLVEHPSARSWRRLIGPLAPDLWPSLRHTALDLLNFPERLKYALRCWAMDRRGQATATSHDLMAAEEVLALHEREFAVIRDEVLPMISPFPMPPPTFEESNLLLV